MRRQKIYLSPRQKSWRHTLNCAGIYTVAYVLAVKSGLSSEIRFLMAVNFLFGLFVISAIIRRTGSTPALQAYKPLPCLKYMVLAFVWPISAPMMLNRVKAYEAEQREASEQGD